MSVTKYCLLFCLSLLDVVYADCSNETSMWNEPAEPRHSCDRPCVSGESMTCHYHFVVENYCSMSKACYNCSTNQSDCYRKDCVSCDGYQRPMKTVNRKCPGPAIKVCKGDELIIGVENAMNEESTSIHWHGILQKGTPYMDGVPMVTQCPIAPGTTFTYKFWANNSGTHFWHAHSGTQRADGMFGSLIVSRPDCDTPYRNMYDDNFTMIFFDWNHATGMDMAMMYQHAGGGNGAKTIMADGRGRWYSDTEQLTSTPVKVYHVEKDKCYLLRMIFAGAYACPIRVSIDNHTMTVVAVDGNDVEPKCVNAITGLAGERVDAIVCANQTNGTYWMRLKGQEACASTLAHGVGIWHYNGSDCTEPDSEVGYDVGPTPTWELNCVDAGTNTTGCVNIVELKSLNKSDSDEGCNATKETPDHKMWMTVDFTNTDNPSFHRYPYYGFYQVDEDMRAPTPQINFLSMKMPNVPPLSQSCDLDRSNICTEDDYNSNGTEYRRCTMIYELPYNKCSELWIINLAEPTLNAAHPFHLHGHAFAVVAMQTYGTNCTVENVKKWDEEGKITRNLDNPPYKDVVSVPAEGITILRVCPNNPGMWFFHCHLEMHLEVNMACIFKVGNVTDFPPVPENFPKCGTNHTGESQSCPIFNITEDTSDCESCSK